MLKKLLTHQSIAMASVAPEVVCWLVWRHPRDQHKPIASTSILSISDGCVGCKFKVDCVSRSVMTIYLEVWLTRGATGPFFFKPQDMNDNNNVLIGLFPCSFYILLFLWLFPSSGVAAMVVDRLFPVSPVSFIARSFYIKMQYKLYNY